MKNKLALGGLILGLLAGCGGGGTSGTGSMGMSLAGSSHTNNFGNQGNSSLPATPDTGVTTAAPRHASADPQTITPTGWTVTDLGPKFGNGEVRLAQNGKALVINLGNALVAETYLSNYGDITPITRPGQFTQVEGYDINDVGEVVARSYTPVFMRGGVTATNIKYFIYFNGEVTELPNSEAFIPFPTLRINNARQIAVTASFPGQPYSTAALYRDGMLKNLGSLHAGLPSAAAALNDRGEVVGFASVGGTRENAFLYKNGRMIDLGHYSDAYDIAHPTAISNSGLITGYLAQLGNDARRHVFLFSHGRMHDLGEGHANAINNRGQIVGRQNGATLPYAVLYQGGKVIDLNALPGVAGSGWHLYEATDINERGQIVGSGVFNGQGRAFLLTPVYGNQ